MFSLLHQHPREEEMEPVRHRRLADLQYCLQIISDQDGFDRADTLIRELGRVERVQVRLGHQVKTWYLNLTRKNQETLGKTGFPDLLKETVDMDFTL